jgi:GT2 family glycosyltransferase
VDFITGCAMLVHRTVFDRCGFFSTRYFMYAEEVDFLWRARLAGYHPSVATRAVIWHKVSASSASEPTQRRYWRIVNQVRFYRKYASSLQKPGLFLYTLLRSVVIAGKSWVTGQRGSAGMSLTAWADGWLKDTPRINP